MGFSIISAAEAASYIKHGYNIGLSGFTPAGSPKAVTPEIAKIADGVIVGSAIVKIIEEHGENAAEPIKEYVSAMKKAANQ